MMVRLKRHQAILCVLVSFLVYGLTWYGVMLTLGDAGSPSLLRSNSVQNLPFNREASFIDQLIVWQINEANLATIDKISEQKSGKVATRNPGDEKVKLKSGLPVRKFNHNQSKNYIIDYPDTVFTITGVTDYHILDIPPPYISAS